MANINIDRDRHNLPNSPECGQWETLLVDAMDGLLRPEDEATFSNHMAACAACTEMFEQVRRGREWLEFLSPEPAVPSYLLDRILVETAHGKLNPNKLQIAGGLADTTDDGSVLLIPPVWQRPGFTGNMRRFAEPRLLMTAAMAFFSIALTLSMTGVRISRVKLTDLKPSVVRSVVEKRIMTASTPIVRYYDHLRFVYEVESRMRELRRSTEDEQKSPASDAPAGDGETHRKDGGSQLHPSEAPQQTVVPASSFGNGELREAGIAILPQNRRRAQEVSPFEKISESRNISPVQLDRATHDFLTITEMAMPKRSTPCIA